MRKVKKSVTKYLVVMLSPENSISEHFESKFSQIFVNMSVSNVFLATEIIPK